MSSARAPLAIVGIGCRFPGGIDGPRAFWDVLLRGIDAVSDVPEDRWNLEAFYGREARRGRMHTRSGGFVRQPIDEIDAGFFGMSPREAAHVSPMQRWLLEACWEALEDAGIAPSDLAGSDAGVFVGGFVEDALTLAHAESNRELLDVHTGTGVAVSILSNRLSYLLDLHGPSMTVDTACSSSLVAAHLAAQAIWSGQCPVAIVGGANAIFKPEFNIAASQANMLSKTGRSRAFDAGADGYTRGEGAGVVVLKPLDRALEDGNPIYAAIRATGVNQDGRTPGITVPNADAQARLMRQVYSQAGISPGQIAYLEAHGTGTPVGDPLEMRALDQVLSDGRAEGDRCPVGTVKTNFGHTEGAAGVAGLIKAALVLRHRTVPANLHLERPSPAIAWEKLRTRVPTSAEPLVRRGPVALAGVNSFGFGGTNAHVLLEEPPARQEPSPREASGPALVPVSARDAGALRALAGRYASWLGGEGARAGLAEVTSTLARRRSHHAHRAALVAGSLPQLREELARLASGEPSQGRSEGRAQPSRVAFVYTGMGPQWWAMGRELLRDEPVFREAIRAFDGAFSRVSGWSIERAMLEPEEASRMARTEVAQPANFALQMGLTELLRSWGVRPSAVVGHSVGEVAAAWAAGALSLEQAALVSFHRSRIQQKAAGLGGMLAASVAPSQLPALLEGLEGRVSLAVVNSPSSVTLAGEPEALSALEARLKQRGAFCRMLRVEVAYHSFQMDPLEREVLASLASLRPKSAEIPLYSTVTAELVDGAALDAGYWWKNVRQTVLMADAADRMIADQLSTFVQIGPHPVLSSPLRECLEARGKPGEVVATLTRQAPEREAVLAAVGKLWILGVEVAWAERVPLLPALSLPTYPWQRQRLWVESDESRQQRLGPVVHPLLGRLTGAVVPTWEHDLGDGHAWLSGHRVQGAVVFPAAGYVEMALAAARELWGGSAFELREVRFRKALYLPEDDASLKTRVTLEPERGRFDVWSSSGGQRPWAHHASGQIRPLDAESASPPLSIGALERRAPERLDVEALYASLARRGLGYEGAFRAVVSARRGEGEVLARLRAPGDDSRYLLHPSLLDGALQALVGLTAGGEGELSLPVGITRMSVYRASGPLAAAHGRGSGDVRLLERDGRVVAELEGLELRAAQAKKGDEERLREGAYVWRWEQALADGSTSAAALSPAALVSQLQGSIDEAARAMGHEARVRSGNALLDQLAVAYALEALSALGLSLDPGALLSPGELAERLRVAPAHRQLFASVVRLLEGEGVFERDGDGLRVARRPAPRPSSQLFAEAIRARPDYHAELELLRRCGSALPAVLWGRVDPLTLVFPREALTTEHLYQDGPSLRLCNLMAREVASALASALPPGRKLRVLEVGAGTGGTAAHVLPALSPDVASYVYTDVTSTFTARARERFAHLSFVETRTLDIGQDPASQGLEPGSFDLVIAANVLHATPDVRRSLDHAARLLAPGGLLMMIEITRLPRMVELTFGQLRDWWSFTDRDLRRDSPCLSYQGWAEALSQTGFDEVARFADPAGEESSLVLARKAAPAAGPEMLPHGTIRLEGRWLVLSDRLLGPRLAQAIAERGGRAELVEVGARSPSEIGRAVAEALSQGEAPRGVVHAASLDAAPPELLDRRSFEDAQRRGAHSALAALQAIVASPLRPSLFLVTRGAVAAGPAARGPLSLAQAPLWGLGRVAINEHPDLPVALVDLDPAGDKLGELSASLCEELARPVVEHEIALRGGERFVHRLVHAPWSEPSRPGSPVVVAPDGRLRAGRRRSPGPGEVEIEVVASSVDGGEIAGRVVATGPGVTSPRQGERVVGLSSGPPSSYALAQADRLAVVPDGIDLESVAALPLAYLAVRAGLLGVRPGDRVLVADASSAQGLLALAEIGRLGAEPLAVAGSPAARDLLRAMGLERVVDGRLARAADEVLRLTSGRPVDRVFHPGTGEATAAELARAMRPLGVLAFAGDDPAKAGDIGSLVVERQIVFLPVAPSRLLGERPDEAREALSELARRLAAGTLAPVPFRACPPGDVAQARSPERRARSFGAQVVSFVHHRARVLPAFGEAPPVRPDATYLITGGLSGVGLATARYLASQGARNLALVGRSGASTDEAREGVAGLERAGVRVLVAPVDVSDEAQVSDLLDRLGREMPPLRGVVHGAMVLDDGFLTQLTPERFDRVLGPKAWGAWNLHVQTRDLPLDFFVLYSSIASVGLRGQANYVAANVFLDALAHDRRARGLPGLSINWGVIGEIGYVSRNAQLYGYFDQQGMRALSPGELDVAIGHYLGRDLPQAFVFPVDWAALAAFAPDMVRSPRFARLAAQAGDRSSRGQGASDAARAARIRQCADKDERRALLSDLIAQLTAAVLGLEPSQIDRDRPATEMGLDSMMAIELSGRLQATLRADVPVARLLSGTSIAQLASQLA